MMNTIKQIKWYPVVDLSAIPEKEGRRVMFRQYEIALFNLGSEYLAIDNQCPHKQGPLADGIISGKSIFCPLHNLKVGLENGCALNGSGQVKTYPVKVAENKVYVAFEEGKFQSSANQDCLVTESESMKDIN